MATFCIFRRYLVALLLAHYGLQHINGFIHSIKGSYTKRHIHDHFRERKLFTISIKQPAAAEVEKQSQEIATEAAVARNDDETPPTTNLFEDWEKKMGIPEEEDVVEETEEERALADVDLALMSSLSSIEEKPKGPHRGASKSERLIILHQQQPEQANAQANSSMVSANISISSSPMNASTNKSASAAVKEQQPKKHKRNFDFIENFFMRQFGKFVPDPDILRVGIKLISTAIWSAIVLSVLGTLGVDTKPLLSVLGVSGLTLSFALKEIITDAFHCLTVLLTHPFSRGAVVTVGSFKGRVVSMTLQQLRLIDENDQTEIILPLTMLYKAPIKIHERPKKQIAAARAKPAV